MIYYLIIVDVLLFIVVQNVLFIVSLNVYSFVDTKHLTNLLFCYILYIIKQGK